MCNAHCCTFRRVRLVTCIAVPCVELSIPCGQDHVVGSLRIAGLLPYPVRLSEPIRHGEVALLVAKYTLSAMIAWRFVLVV